MTIYHWILLTAFSICFLSGLFQFLQIVLSKKSTDYAVPRGKIGKAIIYAFVGAMSPLKKESAMLHLPGYIAGILFHIGTFLSLFWLVLHFLKFTTITLIINASAIFLVSSVLSGIIILMKRMIKPEMRRLSCIDDYFSNLLVTGFQVLSALTLFIGTPLPYLFTWAAILFLYIPLGKLRHVVYFFTSRVHLGMFYGKRGVWPQNRQKL